MKSKIKQHYRASKLTTIEGIAAEHAKPKRPLLRAATAAGRVAGKSFLKEASGRDEIVRIGSTDSFEAIKANAQGLNANALSMIARLTSDSGIPRKATDFEYKDKSSKEIVARDSWKMAAVAGDDPKSEAFINRGLLNAQKMIAPVDFKFGDHITPVKAFTMSTVSAPEGARTVIWLNQHNNEQLADPYPKGTEDPEPKLAFGSVFRILIDQSGTIRMNRSKNTQNGMSDDNEVSFETQELAVKNVSNLLENIEQGIVEQRQFEHIQAEMPGL